MTPRANNTYKCAVCRETFEKGWSDDEAEAELSSKFGVPTDECELVCDDCYRKMMGLPALTTGVGDG